MNIELIKKIRERIAEKPLGYRQTTFGQRSQLAPCGTICCIGGETIICNAPTEEEGIERLYILREQIVSHDRAVGEWFNSVAVEASELLELTEEETDRLFSPTPEETWTPEFAKRWDTVKSHDFINDSEKNRAYANVAVAQLDYLIEHGTF